MLFGAIGNQHKFEVPEECLNMIQGTGTNQNGFRSEEAQTWLKTPFGHPSLTCAKGFSAVVEDVEDLVLCVSGKSLLTFWDDSVV